MNCFIWLVVVFLESRNLGFDVMVCWPRILVRGKRKMLMSTIIEKLKKY